MSLKCVDPNGDEPGWWWFEPPGKRSKIRMINLGGKSISAAACVKIFENKAAFNAIQDTIRKAADDDYING